MTATRERILTDNEKYGSGVLDESGGVWVVANAMTQRVNALFGNRDAAEDYIYDSCEEHERLPDDYCLQVWAVHETWPPKDDD